MTVEKKLLIAVIVIFIMYLVTFFMWLYEKTDNERRAKKRRHRIASDKNGRGIWNDSDVMFRGKKCHVLWDSDMLTFYLIPDDGGIVPKLPFTVHIAKECEVIR